MVGGRPARDNGRLPGEGRGFDDGTTAERRRQMLRYAESQTPRGVARGTSGRTEEDREGERQTVQRRTISHSYNDVSMDHAGKQREGGRREGGKGYTNGRVYACPLLAILPPTESPPQHHNHFIPYNRHYLLYIYKVLLYVYLLFNLL